jgi:microcystin-dependent protein
MADSYIGEIRMFAGKYAPVDWHLCDGSLLAISQYQVLYALIGTTYGGDGMNTFARPDLRGRVPVSTGQGPGLSNYVLGQSFGTENVTLTAATMPTHNHPFNATSTGATSLKPTPSGSMTLAASPSNTFLYAQEANATIVQLAPTDVGAAGGNVSHTNIMPVLAINYIIALTGIYPQFN